MRFINPRQVWLLSYSFITYKCFMGSISYILSKCYLINKVLKNYLFIHEKTNKRKNYSGVSGRIFTPQYNVYSVYTHAYFFTIVCNFSICI